MKLGNGEFWKGDNLELMWDIPDGSVDMIVTSPPYDELRLYGEGLPVWSLQRAKDTISSCFRTLKTGGVFVWVVADGTYDGSESGNSFRQALHVIDSGFKLHDTMIFEKAQAFGGSKYSYLHSFEYMFVFSKGRPATFNPICDRENVRGGISESTAKAGMRPDGTIPERKMRTAANLGKRKNIWRYGVGGSSTGHPAVFPVKLAHDHIVSWSNPGDLVLDPFAGSGTTAIAAERTGRKWLCIEQDAEYYDKACNRVKEELRQGKLI